MEECESGISWLIPKVILVFVTVAGNLLVIVSVLVVKVLRKPKNYLILSLAVADLLVGLFVLPFKITFTQGCYDWKPGSFVCRAWMSFVVFFVTASIMGLTVISIDRYLAIAHSLFYKVNATPRKIYITIAGSWVFSLGVTFPHWGLVDRYTEADLLKGSLHFSICINYQPPWHHIFGFLFGFFLPLSIMIFVYGTIWKILATQKPRLSTHNESMCRHHLSSSAPSAPCVICRFLRKRKGCIMLGTVTGVFVVCWLPFFSTSLADAIFKLSGEKMQIHKDAHNVLVWMGYLNSCANPFIYTMFNRNFRFAFKELICLRCSSLNSKIRNNTYTKQVGSSGTDPCIAA